MSWSLEAARTKNAIDLVGWQVGRSFNNRCLFLPVLEAGRNQDSVSGEGPLPPTQIAIFFQRPQRAGKGREPPGPLL